MIIDPVFVLLVIVFIIGTILIRSILVSKLKKIELIIFSINLILALVSIFIYDNQIKQNEMLETIYTYYKYANYGLALIYLFILGEKALSSSREHQLFIKSIKNTTWNAYYVVDKKERIKDISLSLLRELDLNRNEVIGEKLFTVFNKSFRFSKLNGVETNNKMLEHFYDEYKNRAKKGESEIEELILYNYKGEEIALHVNIEPIYSFNRYAGRVMVGEIKTDFDLLSVEKNLNKTKIEIASLQEKLIGLFETSNEGLFSIDLDERYVWLSDHLAEKLKYNENVIELNMFRSRIEPSDLHKYLAVIAELTVNNPFYQATYRINVNGTYIWVKEKGKRIFESGSSATIIGSIEQQKTRHFLSSDIDNLDSLKSKEELILLCQKLINDKKYFHLALFKINNVPDINEEYGRGVGNLVLSEYVSNLRESFVTESSDIFRIDGLVFAIPITEPRKAEFIKKGSMNDNKLLNKKVSYGALSFDVEVLAGISISPDDFKDASKLYEAAKHALKAAEEKTNNNVIYHEDLS